MHAEEKKICWWPTGRVGFRSRWVTRECFAVSDNYILDLNTPRTPAVNPKPSNPSLSLPLCLVRPPSLLRMPMQDQDTKAESADKGASSGILCIISKIKNVIEMNLTTIFFLEYNLTCKMHDIFACTLDLLQYLLQKSKSTSKYESYAYSLLIFLESLKASRKILCIWGLGSSDDTPASREIFTIRILSRSDKHYTFQHFPPNLPFVLATIS